MKPGYGHHQQQQQQQQQQSSEWLNGPGDDGDGVLFQGVSVAFGLPLLTAQETEETAGRKAHRHKNTPVQRDKTKDNYIRRGGSGRGVHRQGSTSTMPIHCLQFDGQKHPVGSTATTRGRARTANAALNVTARP